MAEEIIKLTIEQEKEIIRSIIKDYPIFSLEDIDKIPNLDKVVVKSIDFDKHNDLLTKIRIMEFGSNLVYEYYMDIILLKKVIYDWLLGTAEFIDRRMRINALNSKIFEYLAFSNSYFSNLSSRISSFEIINLLEIVNEILYDPKINEIYYNASELRHKDYTEDKLFYLIKKNQSNFFNTEKIILNSFIKFIVSQLGNITLEGLIDKVRMFLSYNNLSEFYFEGFFDTKRTSLLSNPILIKKYIYETPEIFVIDENNKIRLVEDKTFYQYHFERLLIKQKALIDIFKNAIYYNYYITKKLNWATIISIRFKGNKFPLEEAKEYIELRKIIYLYGLESYGNIVDYKSDLSYILTNEFYENLNALIPDEKELVKFINENLDFSLFFLPREQLNSTVEFLIKEFSPILNLKGNRGNLFYYTISKKVEKLRNENKQSTD